MHGDGASMSTLLTCWWSACPRAFFSILAYMPQDEMFLDELTPREHLGFLARLRLHKADPAAQSSRVEQVLPHREGGARFGWEFLDSV